MKFCEKLDFLMKITNTTNSYLSMHIALDSSHISRLRRGERQFVSNAEYKKNGGVFRKTMYRRVSKDSLTRSFKNSYESR